MVNRTSSLSEERQLALDALLTKACNDSNLNDIREVIASGANVDSVAETHAGNEVSQLMCALSQ